VSGLPAGGAPGGREARADAGPTEVRLPIAVYERLVGTVRRRSPGKSFGYLISDVDETTATDCVFFEDNIRNDDGWRQTFEAYGDYYVQHRDAGFVADPQEAWRLQRQIWARNMFEVGVFHSHHRHPANFSRIDYEMHVQRFASLWHLIVSVRNPRHPVVRAFAVSEGGVRELPVHVVGPLGSGRDARSDGTEIPPRSSGGRDAVVARARRLATVDGWHRPTHPDLGAVASAVAAVLALGDGGLAADVLGGLLAGADERAAELVAADLRPVGPARFTMGDRGDDPGRRHACGEGPAHQVRLSPFHIGATAVTNRQWARFEPRRGDVPARDRDRPVTGVSWAEAWLFARWLDCRLPTEAEWEYAAAAGSSHDWCCGGQEGLARHAWYCANSGGEVHPVATREPNALGLHDLHGNVWEWCHDRYDAGFYGRSPRVDPVCTDAAGGDRVARGGSAHGHADMCRTRYRSHEPATFTADDLGFRLVRDGEHRRGRSLPW
jgi:proteasome lid subunit RPN8/RPN11